MTMDNLRSRNDRIRKVMERRSRAKRRARLWQLLGRESVEEIRALLSGTRRVPSRSTLTHGGTDQ